MRLGPEITRMEHPGRNTPEDYQKEKAGRYAATKDRLRAITTMAIIVWAALFVAFISIIY